MARVTDNSNTRLRLDRRVWWLKSYSTGASVGDSWGWQELIQDWSLARLRSRRVVVRGSLGSPAWVPRWLTRLSTRTEIPFSVWDTIVRHGLQNSKKGQDWLCKNFLWEGKKVIMKFFEKFCSCATLGYQGYVRLHLHWWIRLNLGLSLFGI